MGAAKEMWFAEMERLCDKYMDEGMDPEDAYDLACQEAQSTLLDRLADRADAERKRAREEGR
jgi:hypothetical protein